MSININIGKVHLAIAVLIAALLVPATAVATHIFDDVPDEKFYAEPVAWAATNSITTGKSPTIFDPEGNVTRGESVTFLKRYDDNIVQPGLDGLADEIATLSENVKSISFDPAGFFPDGGANFQNSGSTQNTGLVFPDGGFPSLTFIAVLPPDLTPGSQVRVEVFWHINESGCTINMSQNFLSVTRLGQVILASPTDEVPYIKIGGFDTSEVRRSAVVTTRDGGYLPGDIVKYGLFRSSTNDTCTDDVFIDGARVLYD